jgi:hypothetical protein
MMPAAPAGQRAAAPEILPAASNTLQRDPDRFDRETVLALFGIWQFLGLAALAGWGLKVTRAAAAEQSAQGAARR